MSPLLVAALSLLAAEVEPPASDMHSSSEDPARLAFLFITPSGELEVVRSAEVVSFVDRTVADRTDLELDRLDASLVRECRGRVSCFVRAARPDYQRRVYFLPSGGIMPFSEHRAYVRDRGLSVARFLLLASGVGTSDGDSLAFTLLDLDRALAFVHEREQLSRRDEAELLQTSTVGGPLRVDLDDVNQLSAALDRLERDVLEPALSDAGHWDPFGTLIIAANAPGAGVYVGDRLLATTGLEPTQLTRIPPGRQRVRLVHPDYIAQEREIDVPRGGQAQLRLDLEPRPSEVARALHAGTFWGGLGLVAAGAALTVAGAVDAANAPTVVCTGCSPTFRRLSTGPLEDPTRAPSSSGPLIIPLGYSLALTGATWAGGAWLTDRDRAPWLPLLLGVLAGGAAYGLSEAAVLSDPDQGL